MFILPGGTLNFLAQTNQINGDSSQFLWLGFWKSEGNQSRKLGHLFTSQLFVCHHPCVDISRLIIFLVESGSQTKCECDLPKVIPCVHVIAKQTGVT